MITTIYANYGVLAHEYQTVYTTAPHEHAVTFEKIAIEIPDSFNPYYNYLDEIVIRIPGSPWPHMLSEVLTTVKGKLPGMRWYDGHKGHTVALDIVEESKHDKVVINLIHDLD